MIQGATGEQSSKQADLSGKEGAPLPLLGTNSEGQRGGRGGGTVIDFLGFLVGFQT